MLCVYIRADEECNPIGKPRHYYLRIMTTHELYLCILHTPFLPSAFFFGSPLRNLKNHFFTSNFFLSSTYTYTSLILEFGTILPLFAIFNNFIPF
jgi:hypothetical protein